MDTEKNDLSKARKKRRQKIVFQRFSKFLTAIIVLAVISFGVWICVREDFAGIIGDRIAAAATAEGSMPREIAGTSVKSTFAVGNNIGVLTDGVCYIYSVDGKQLLSYQHGMVNPMVDTAGRRFLLYDQGGNKITVRTRDKVLFEYETEGDIISANLCADGSLSVVTTAKRYASQVHVWDSSYKSEIFTWSSADEYVITASMDKNSKTVAAAALTAGKSGQIITHVHIFTTEAAIELADKKFSGVSVLSLEYNEQGNIKLICDSVSMLLDTKCGVLGSTEYNQCPIAYVNISGTDSAVLIFDKFTEMRTTELIFLGSNMISEKKVSVSGKFATKSADENRLAFYSSGKVFVFNYAGERLAVLESEKDALLLDVVGENLFAVTRNELKQIIQ